MDSMVVCTSIAQLRAFLSYWCFRVCAAMLDHTFQGALSTPYISGALGNLTALSKSM